MEHFSSKQKFTKAYEEHEIIIYKHRQKRNKLEKRRKYILKIQGQPTEAYINSLSIFNVMKSITRVTDKGIPFNQTIFKFNNIIIQRLNNPDRGRSNKLNTQTTDWDVIILNTRCGHLNHIEMCGFLRCGRWELFGAETPGIAHTNLYET